MLKDLPLGGTPSSGVLPILHLIVLGDEQPRWGHLVFPGPVLCHDAVAFVDNDVRFQAVAICSGAAVVLPSAARFTGGSLRTLVGCQDCERTVTAVAASCGVSEAHSVHICTAGAEVLADRSLGRRRRLSAAGWC